MDILRYPARGVWSTLISRALASQASQVTDVVSAIMDDVALRGDTALREYEERFTGAHAESLAVGKDEIERAASLISVELRDAIESAARNIAAFHSAEMPLPVEVETAPGVVCMQRPVAIERVGLYIPGGNSPLFSTVLMLAVPAKIAGCPDIELCTPADADGSIHPAILYAAKVAGVDRIFRTGGAQAIAAMTFGTATVPRVDKIFGPGNRYVMEAKQQAALHGCAIDMPAGPSEVLVVADDSADPVFVASDFLSQAEHGPDSQSILLTTSPRLIDCLPAIIDEMLSRLPRRDMMMKSLGHSRLILMHDDAEMMEFSNLYAPEHLILNHRDADRLCTMVRNAGSVFVGPWSPESAGDYASGTNHTLPTSGYARAYSGVNIDSFMRKITFQKLTREGIAGIAPVVIAMAEAESLDAHALAAKVRTTTY
ncbi:histidinol dehydrogenase [uncultured Muribaculum sp.]|uniref:histidinol dehydrogenase n=1 Tax=uncultured Muribaculum sp. TaxID=1918613 RepID=UPI0025F64776|nr:histidinol dehydrogenase [uncultured Muribaculum sp.]